VGTIKVAAVVCGCVLGVLVGIAFPQQPDQLESLLASARDAQARSDFDAAAEFYRQAVSIRPEIPELRTNLGLMYYQTGKDERAIDAFRQAIRLNPGLSVPNLFLGLDYVKLKRFNEAIPYLKRAAVSKPTDMQAQLALGQAYRGSGKTRLATASYLRAVQLDPGQADAWFHLGVSYLEQVEANARILLANKNSGYFHALEAETFSEQRAFIQAAAAYKEALAFPDSPPGMHAGYGFALLGRHDFPGAERELRAELASNPGSLLAKLGLARLQVEQDAASEGGKEIEDIWNTDSGFLRANAPLLNAGLPNSKRLELQVILEASQARGEVPEEVVVFFQSSASGEKFPDFSPDSKMAGEAPASSTQDPSRAAAELYARGQYRGCASLLVSKLPMLQARDLRFLATCAYSTGNYQPAAMAGQRLAMSPATEAEGLYWEIRSAQKLAIQALARASEIDSNSPTLHVLLGDIYRQRKYFPDAEQEYRKALALQPHDTGALFGLSLTLLASSDFDEALHLAQEALNKNPEDPELNALMGEIFSVQHNFLEAEPYLKKGLNTKPELVPHVHALLGRVYAETNRTQQAIAEYKLGLPDDKDGRLHFQLGRLYLKVGDREASKQAFAASDRIRREGLTRAAVAMQQGEDAEPE
jgi:tetratricopeptide (TPR) repeat protein